MDCEFIKARDHPTWFSVLSAQHAVRSSQRLIDVDQENGCECDEIYFVFLGGWADARQTYSSKDQVMFLFLVYISGKRRPRPPIPSGRAECGTHCGTPLTSKGFGNFRWITVKFREIFFEFMRKLCIL